MKMICSILLLLSLTSCVSGAFEVKEKQTSYQAEENHNITLEWMFTTRTNSSSKSLYILCRLSAEPKNLVLFHLYRGVEVPESQDQQFTGRVRMDKDVLRDGQIRLHISRLRINDSGRYKCFVDTGEDRGSWIFHLNVTAAADEPKPPRPRIRPQSESPTNSSQPERPGKIGLYVGLTAALLVLFVVLCSAFLHKSTGKRGNTYTDVQMMSFLEEQPIRTNQASTSDAEIRSCLEGNPQAAKMCENSYVTCCPTTYPNLNHSRSMSDLNYWISMRNLNHSTSIPNLNYSRSIPNLNY